MDMPEKIFADPPSTFDGSDVWHSENDKGRVEYIRSDLFQEAMKNADQMEKLMSQMAQQAETIDQLLDAIHDAICRPKGVVPESADQFYDSRRAGIASMIYEAKVKAGKEK